MHHKRRATAAAGRRAMEAAEGPLMRSLSRGTTTPSDKSLVSAPSGFSAKRVAQHRLAAPAGNCSVFFGCGFAPKRC